MKFLKVKNYRQRTGLCGVACLKMVLDYYGRNVSENELVRLSGATPEQGTSFDGFKKAAKRLNFIIKKKDQAGFSDIQNCLKKNIPPIVSWFLEDDGHYSVAVGLDEKYIYLQDPHLGRIRKLKREDFLRLWFDFEGEYMKTEKDLVLRRTIVIQKQKKILNTKS